MLRPRFPTLPAQIIAASLLAGGLFPCAALAGAGWDLPGDWPRDWTGVFDAMSRLLADGYRRHPALMAGLAGLAVVPALVVIGVVLRGFQPEIRQRIASSATADLPRAAWLEVDGITGGRVPVGGELTQIGREDDNDVCIDDATVHRYHAVIERSRDVGFVITDVSGPSGNGVRVNGERMLKSSLAHGDVVEIGQARLKFATVL